MTECRQSRDVAIVGEPVPPETVLHVGMATPLTKPPGAITSPRSVAPDDVSTPLRIGVDDPPSGKAPLIETASTSRRFAGATSPRLRCAPRGVEVQVQGRAWVEEQVGHMGVAAR